MGSPSLSQGQTLIAACAAGWVFFLLSWFLERPFIWDAAERRISRYAKLPPKEMTSLLDGLHNRTVGGIHNTIQVLLCLYALKDRLLWEDTWEGVTPLTEGILVVSAGFFLWDIAVSVRRAPTDGAAFILHGVLCFVFYLYVALTGHLHFYGCGFLLWELSTPFVHLRWVLHKIGMKNTKLYLYNGLLMMGVFCLCRIVWGGYLGVRFFVDSLTPHPAVSPIAVWALRCIWVALYGLCCYWFRLMVFAALRLVKQAYVKEDSKTVSNGTKVD